jgi:hypothetical protein
MKDNSDPFPHLPRRVFFVPGEFELPATKSNTDISVVEVRTEKALLGDGVIIVEQKPKRVGRPKIEGARPWELEGISKALYYRRRQRAKG